jgi:heparanase
LVSRIHIQLLILRKRFEQEKVLAYTKSIGGKIAAAEFMNEPTLAGMGGAPVGYDARAYGRDLAVFHSFMKKTRFPT